MKKWRRKKKQEWEETFKKRKKKCKRNTDWEEIKLVEQQEISLHGLQNSQTQLQLQLGSVNSKYRSEPALFRSQKLARKYRIISIQVIDELRHSWFQSGQRNCSCEDCSSIEMTIGRLPRSCPQDEEFFDAEDLFGDRVKVERRWR